MGHARVTTPNDPKPTLRDRLTEMALLVDAGGNLRVRISSHVYRESDRSYFYLPDAVWTVAIPQGDQAVGQMETFLEVVGECITAIGDEGPEKVRDRLRAILVVEETRETLETP